MKKLTFNNSKFLSVGIELELQLIHPVTFDLFPRVNSLLSAMTNIEYAGEIKPEITHSMLEINSLPHEKIANLHEEILELSDIVTQQAKNLGILLSGGGAHPFQNWRERTIYPDYWDVYEKYDFLMKKFTVFGQHIHIGCQNDQDAMYLIHAFSRYIPHFIALSASSPFFEGEKTQFDSVRLHIIDAFPFSGTIPFLTSWDEFNHYYQHLVTNGVIKKIGNLYWDIRPQPQYGTLEIRVFDSPLTLTQVITNAAYLQTLALYLLEERPFSLSNDMYFFYEYNRFQAARYGLNGMINPYSCQNSVSIQSDILQTLAKLRPYAKFLQTERYLELIYDEVTNGNNAARQLRQAYSQNESLEELVKFQSSLWCSQFVKTEIAEPVCG